MYNVSTSYRPEGGWEEPNELDLFEQNGFQKVTLGSRVLRSDVAVVSLLALANEVCSKISGDACSNNKEND
jgi:RsmE family RNA methyltransferase